MAKSKIEWCDRVWNPITGCTKISPGCLNCYAERMSKRFAEPWGLPKDDPFKVTMHHDRLKQPLHWKKDSKVFVCSMADIFHDDVTDAVLDQIFGVMLATKVLNNRPDHTFMVLTKRAERMYRYFTSRTPAKLLEAWAFATDWVNMEDGDVLFHEYIEGLVCHDWDEKGTNSSGSEYKEWGYPKQLFPLSNVWLGVTAENQEQVDKRIPLLLTIPTVKRFVSVEPMLEAMNIFNYICPGTKVHMSISVDGALRNKTFRGFQFDDGRQMTRAEAKKQLEKLQAQGIKAIGSNKCDNFDPSEGCRGHKKVILDWVICGAETGQNARPMDLIWARDLRNQCAAVNVPFFFKKAGPIGTLIPVDLMIREYPDHEQ